MRRRTRTILWATGQGCIALALTILAGMTIPSIGRKADSCQEAMTSVDACNGMPDRDADSRQDSLSTVRTSSGTDL